MIVGWPGTGSQERQHTSSRPGPWRSAVGARAGRERPQRFHQRYENAQEAYGMGRAIVRIKRAGTRKFPSEGPNQELLLDHQHRDHRNHSHGEQVWDRLSRWR